MNQRSRRPIGRVPALALAFALALAAAPAAALAQDSASPEPAGIRVSGLGVAYGEPDRALLDLGVEVAAPAVRDALAQADAAMRAIRDAFLAGGVDERDIRTASFNVWREDRRDDSGTLTGERYHVQHTYQVTLRQVDQLGPLLAQAVDAGANRVDGIRFDVGDRSALERQARQAAMQDARERAQQLADAAGVTLGDPVAIDETLQGGPVGMPMYARADGLGGGSPVEGGQLAVTIQVDVRYALR